MTSENNIAPVKMPTRNTRTKILTSLLGRDLSALDLRTVLGINESAIRRHLDILENRGLIEHRFEKASKGRPKKLYRITDRGRSLFPRESGILLSILTEKLVEEFGRSEVERLMDLVAEGFADRLIGEERSGSTEEILNRLVEAFNDLGFYCDLTGDGDAYVMEYRNCVFADVPSEFSKWVCLLHQKVLGKVLGDIEIDQVSSIMAGDDHCLQRLELNS